MTEAELRQAHVIVAQSIVVHPEWSTAQHVSYLESEESWRWGGKVPHAEVVERWVRTFKEACAMATSFVAPVQQMGRY